MRLLSVPENQYGNLPENHKIKRVKLFVKLATILDQNIFHNLDLEKIKYYIENRILEDDFEYMNIEELLLLRGLGFLDDSKIYELFPEEFDYLDGIPVLMWDQL